MLLVMGLAGTTEAIFTTDKFSDLVNGNIYKKQCDVYLNGG